MPYIVVALVGLAVGGAASVSAYLLIRKRGSEPVAAAGLAITVFACSIAFVAYPLEKVFTTPLARFPQTPPGGGGHGPSVTERDSAPAGVSAAWGPERTMYTNSEPADHPVMNSIADNPNVGDERVFFAFKDAAHKEDGGWQRSGELKPGRTYVFRMYLNAAGADYLEAADLRGVTAHAQLPENVGGQPEGDSAGAAQYCGFLTSSNAQPSQIWSCGVFLAATEVEVFPNPSSVKLYNNHFGTSSMGPLNLGASIFTNEGQLLGFDRMDGHVPSGYHYALYLYFELKVERA
ncbi:hypothetical protein ACIA47_25220 [Micromonospora sp. NPDC051227]|uniref:hypothetical protein n=1 Tax=Micromonospora sp. NPDC051227 TaxID=3364285 RepID=UPI003787D8BF